MWLEGNTKRVQHKGRGSLGTNESMEPPTSPRLLPPDLTFCQGKIILSLSPLGPGYIHSQQGDLLHSWLPKHAGSTLSPTTDEMAVAPAPLLANLPLCLFIVYISSLLSCFSSPSSWCQIMKFQYLALKTLSFSKCW